MSIKKKETVLFVVHNKEFKTLKEAEEYSKKIESISYYIVNTGFDATEGRGFRSLMKVMVLPDGYNSPEDTLRWYLQNKIGKEFNSWYGDSFYPSWKINKVDKDKYEGVLKSKVQSEVFLSEDNISDIKNITLKDIKENLK